MTTTNHISKQRVEQYILHIHKFDKMIKGLAKTHGLNYITFLEPIGLLDIGNKWCCEDPSLLPRFETFVTEAETTINKRRLPMTEIADRFVGKT